MRSAGSAGSSKTGKPCCAALRRVLPPVEGIDATLAMVALGCGVVPELVRKDSPLRGRVEQVNVAKRPRGYHASLRSHVSAISFCASAADSRCAIVQPTT